MSDFAVLQELERVLKQRLATKPDDSYVASLYAKGLVKILDKMGEEAAELMVAAACDEDERVVNEAADTYFHLLIFMVFAGINLDDLNQELKNMDSPKKDATIKESIAAMGSGLGQLIGELSICGKDGSFTSEGVINKLSGLLSLIGSLHSSRGIDFNLVANELEKRMRHK